MIHLYFMDFTVEMHRASGTQNNIASALQVRLGPGGGIYLLAC